MFITKRVEKAWNLLVFLARFEEQNRGQHARGTMVFAETGIVPTDDIWKALMRANLINSIRGFQGGYMLAKIPDDINLTRVSEIICERWEFSEGPFSSIVALLKKRCEKITLRDFLADEGE